ncbi:MAG: hypothetical protein N2442_04260 [Spirochaetes bacterium]|nr:hypothetical protein [Spirochaetota bacterium]
MKPFLRLRVFHLALAALFLTASFSYPEELATNARIHKKFKLLPGKADNRYVVYVPFEVTRPGRVRVYHQLTGGDFRIEATGGLPNYVLADARIFEKVEDSVWVKMCKTVVNYVPTLKLEAAALKEIIQEVRNLLGKESKPNWYHGTRDLIEKGEPLILDVDDKDLRTTKGRYVVILRNPSPGEYHGNILISFPGDVWEVDADLEATYERKPDLAIERIELDPDNRVVVTVANYGPGWLDRVRYNPKDEGSIRLEIEVDGKKALSVPIAEVDPKFSLVLRGTPVTYRTDIQLRGPARVSAIIDSGEVVAEPDERNNRKRENLTPKQAPSTTTTPGQRVKRD